MNIQNQVPKDPQDFIPLIKLHWIQKEGISSHNLSDHLCLSQDRGTEIKIDL